MDDLQGKNINQDDLAHLISQGVLKTQEEQNQNDKEEKAKAELEVELANRNITNLSYVYEEYLNHDNFGDVFSISFISFKPMKNLESFNNIPNKIFLDRYAMFQCQIHRHICNAKAPHTKNSAH